MRLPSQHTLYWLVGALTLAGLTVVALYRGSAAAAPPRLTDLDLHNQDIAFYERRIVEDTLSAADMSQLAGLYLQRSRETGRYEDLVAAESTARRSLALRDSRNSRTAHVLASSLLAQHRYGEAAEVATRLCADEPEQVSYCALSGEIALELGDYDAASATFASLALHRRNLSVAPRLARWAEILGAPETAGRLLQIALEGARARRDMPAEQLAWFHLRAGDLALRHGRFAEAERAFETGLRIAPDDYRILSAMARLEAARGRLDRAITAGERAIAIVLDPATLGLLGDCYAALRDTARASEYYRAMEVSVLNQPGPFHRAWSLYLLDHDRSLPEVLDQAEREIAVRKDIYGFDLLGWALHKNGYEVEAREALRTALRFGTEDALLHFHAGIIERALGDGQAARYHLEQALRINDRFDPRHRLTARATLDSLIREAGGRS